MRGTHPLTVENLANGGIIPAYAGNTTAENAADHDCWDHPRVCGEHPVNTPLGVMVAGSSPRMRGTLV